MRCSLSFSTFVSFFVFLSLSVPLTSWGQTPAKDQPSLLSTVENDTLKSTHFGEKVVTTNTVFDLLPSDTGLVLSAQNLQSQLDKISLSHFWHRLQENGETAPIFGQNDSSSIHHFNGMYQSLNEQEPELFQLLEEARNSEFFIAADVQAAKNLEAISRFSNSNVPYLTIATLELSDSENEDDFFFYGPYFRATAYSWIELGKDPTAVQTPTIYAGTRLKSVEIAKKQFRRLDNLIPMFALPQVLPPGISPPTKETIAGSDFWVLPVELEPIVPWDEGIAQLSAGFNSDETEKIDQLKEAFAHIRKLKGVLCFGIHQDYLLITFGPDTKHLEELGTVNINDLATDEATATPSKRLSQVDDFQPIVPHLVDNEVLLLAYSSKEFAEANDPKLLLRALHGWIRHMATAAKVLSENDRQLIHNDLDELYENLVTFLPNVSSAASILYESKEDSSENRYEYYSYTGVPAQFEGKAKPLSILSHTTKDPLVVVAASDHSEFQRFHKFAEKYLRKGELHFQNLALPYASKDEHDQYYRVSEVVRPLFEEYFRITNEQFFPALGKESALVVTSTQKVDLTPGEPPHFYTALALLEPSILLELSDNTLFENAIDDYLYLLEEIIIDSATELASRPGPYMLPDWKVEEKEYGTFYRGHLLKRLGFGDFIDPSIGISKNLGVISLFPDQIDHFMKKEQLELPSSLSIDRPRFGLLYVNLNRGFHLVEESLRAANIQWIIHEDGYTPKWRRDIFSPYWIEQQEFASFFAVVDSLVIEAYPEKTPHGKKLVSHGSIVFKDLTPRNQKEALEKLEKEFQQAEKHRDRIKTSSRT
ncbi:MAG: hypothetical protein MPJ24_02445 [Pirellulaceae bacterium]|nr:hypothetical protein [Pirellulaceae bacterium]